MASNIIEWNSNINLDKETILLVFSTSWCPPCKQLVPILNELNNMIVNNQFKICKIDCEEHPEISKNFSIKSVPTIIFCHKGQMTSYNENRNCQQMYQWIINKINN